MQRCPAPVRSLSSGDDMTFKDRGGSFQDPVTVLSPRPTDGTPLHNALSFRCSGRLKPDLIYKKQ
jgi:hypothetical protein